MHDFNDVTVANQVKYARQKTWFRTKLHGMFPIGRSLYVSNLLNIFFWLKSARVHRWSTLVKVFALNELSKEVSRETQVWVQYLSIVMVSIALLPSLCTWCIIISLHPIDSSIAPCKKLSESMFKKCARALWTIKLLWRCVYHLHHPYEPWLDHSNKKIQSIYKTCAVIWSIERNSVEQKSRSE